MNSPFAARTHQEMKEVLLYPDAKGPEVHYYMIRGGTEKSNVTIWESGTVGGEYIKTFGHYHVDDLPEIYHVASGEGILLTQVRALASDGAPIDDEIESFTATFAKVGDVLTIPPKAGHLMVNTGPRWLVTTDDSPVDLGEHDGVSKPSHAAYGAIGALHGFAYYVVEENGKPAFVPNKNYKKIPEVIIK